MLVGGQASFLESVGVNADTSSFFEKPEMMATGRM
jgi:hypothetical protein